MTRAYHRLLNDAVLLYGQRRFEEAYDLVRRNRNRVGGNPAQIMNFLYALACRAGKPQEGLALFREAVLEKGYWYAADYLESDEDLDPIREEPGFVEAAEISKKREAEARKSAKPVLKVVRTKKEGKRPLLVALHGNQGNADLAAPFWGKAVAMGFHLGLAQASRPAFWNAYEWDDAAESARELAEHVKALISEEAIDPGRLVLGSFSAGAGPALKALLDGTVRAKKAVFMGPWLPELGDWKKDLPKLKKAGTFIHILCGKADADCLEDAEAFDRALTEAGAPHAFDLIGDLNHTFPEDFDQRLAKILET